MTIQSGGSRLNAWGLLDVWRRPKPEYWHVRRAYAPLRLHPESLKQADGAWQIEIENRFCHTDWTSWRSAGSPVPKKGA